MTRVELKLAAFEATYVPVINRYLAQAIPVDSDQPLLTDAMTYSVNAGGKRLRPLLTLAVLKTLRVPLTAGHIRAASALELLHTYSLIHDDLPAMDNDDLRRGVPTNHVKFGAGMATLAGDGLLTLAFQWLADSQLPVAQRLALVQGLSVAAGPSGMVAGQARDISSEHQQLKLPQLEQLHRQKTGALLHYAVQAGTIMGETDGETTQLLLAFADQFGLAFQIYDDLLDVTATTAELGKQTHKDAAEAKNTYPGLFGVAGTRQRLREVVASAEENLTKLQRVSSLDTSLLASFCSYFRVKE